MQYVPFSAFAAVCFAGALRAGGPAPSYSATGDSVSTKVAGRIGACMVGQNDKPRICFGLTKEFDGDPQFTFLVLFRTGKRRAGPRASRPVARSTARLMKPITPFSWATSICR